MLREIADAQVTRVRARAAEGGQLAGQQFHERGLAGAIAAEQGNAVAGIKREVDLGQQHALAIAGGLLFDGQQRTRQLQRRLEAELEGRIDVRRRDARHALEGLEAALGLAGLGGLGAEALDEGLHVLDLALLAREQRGLLGQLRTALGLEVRVVAAVGNGLAVFEIDDAVDDAVEELAVMRDEDQRARIVAQPVFQPQDGIEVQVVGGLVQQQQVRAAHQCLGHIEAHAPATRELAHRACFVGGREAQAIHQLRGTAARVIAAGGGVLHIEVGEPGAIVAALLDLRDALLDGAQRGVPVQHEVHRELVGGIELL